LPHTVNVNLAGDFDEKHACSDLEGARECWQAGAQCLAKAAQSTMVPEHLSRTLEGDCSYIRGEGR